MHRTLLTLAAITLCLHVELAAGEPQDPLIVSPDAYRLEFENAWVRVVRVVYRPASVIPPHTHTRLASAYVYLNDGPPIVFRHEGLPYAAVTRPATVAGSVRLYKGIDEVHSVENASATASEFLRVEFKTVPAEEALLKGKFLRTGRAGVAEQRVEFENAQVRITRITLAAGQPQTLRAAADAPALLVALAATSLAGPGVPRRVLAPGTTAWLAADETAEAGGAHDGELLRFDFRTRPLGGPR